MVFSASCAFFFLGGVIVFLWLKTLSENNLTFGEYFVLSAGGALFPLFLGITLVLLLDLAFSIKVNLIAACLVIFIICCFAVYWFSRRNKPQSLSSRPPEQTKKTEFKQLVSDLFTLRPGAIPALLLILIFIGSVYIRLAFISGLITPLYFDSATHYSIVQGLISKFEMSSLATIDSLVEGYYHLGFHFLIATISLALHLDAKSIILIFGQIILAFLPLPLFFLVRRVTKLDAPTIFTVLLAGWGWSMPAYVLNWGKYPALTSILTFEFVLCSLYLMLRSPKRYRWILASISGFCVVVSTFIHTRSLVLIVIAIASGAAGLGWQRLPKFARAITLCVISGGLITLLFMIQSKPVLTSIFQPYQAEGLWMILLVLLLFPFALKEFPATTFSITLSLLLLLGSLFIPVTRLLPGYDVQTLLDRPFVEMFLFFPLAFLGGLGYAGLVRTTDNFEVFQGSKKLWAYALIAIVVFGAIAINITQYKFFPSTCCQFFGEQDAVALDWMNRNIPPDAKILIASSDSFVLDSPSPSLSGTDGGVWITPLIHRNSVYLNLETNFSAQQTLDDLCKDKITHIYVGWGDESFDSIQLQNQPAWYEMLLLFPKAQVYKVVGCH